MAFQNIFNMSTQQGFTALLKKNQLKLDAFSLETNIPMLFFF